MLDPAEYDDVGALISSTIKRVKEAIGDPEYVSIILYENKSCKLEPEITVRLSYNSEESRKQMSALVKEFGRMERSKVDPTGFEIKIAAESDGFPSTYVNLKVSGYSPVYKISCEKTCHAEFEDGRKVPLKEVDVP